MLPIHERILTLLREIDGICRENGIVYYLHGGTLLGAVRQGGFLPWDDDGDVIMTRENWEKFLAAFDRAPLPGRALECLEHHPQNLRLFPRYLDTGTTMAFITGMENTGFDCVTVDILIFEELPREEGKRRAYERWLLVLGELVCRRYVLSRETPWGLYRLCRLGEKLLGRRRVEGWIRRRKPTTSRCPSSTAACGSAPAGSWAGRRRWSWRAIPSMPPPAPGSSSAMSTGTAG